LVKGGAAPKDEPGKHGKTYASKEPSPYEPGSKFSQREQQIQFAQSLIANACPRQELVRIVMTRYSVSASKAYAIIRRAYEDIKANTPNPEERRINIEQMILNNYRRAHLSGDIRAANQAALLYAQITGSLSLADSFKRVLDGLAATVSDPQVIGGVQRLHEQLTAKAAKGNLAALEQAEQLSEALIRCGISVERSAANGGRRGVLVLPAERMDGIAPQNAGAEEPPEGGDAQ